ncbi:Gfo/Idh/MocA family oxidoreductase [Cereibacter sp. SYSU M97828]|nr:Gfo/Idh/MocA family oxidoreductase [Cereibacter flavus]
MRPIRLGMVGGGAGAFIGGVHRIAARMDGQFQLVAGALSSNPETAWTSAEALGIRGYDSFADMAKAEARKKDGIEAVAIVTPNHMHVGPAKEFLKRGIHVICDKPLAATGADAKALARAAESSDALFILTHNYTGYPMIRQARAMVAAGDLGKVRLVQVEYVQDWLTEAVDTKGANWRTDPKQAGAGAIGDVGTHAWNLAAFVAGQEPSELAADLTSFVPGRAVDDNAHIMTRYADGAKGMLWISQVAPGNENNIRLRIYGDKGGIEWSQDDCNVLWFTPYGEPKRMLTRNGAGSHPDAARVSRVPGGHPEGYLEAFANIYAEAARAIRAHQAGEQTEAIYPSLRDGLAGMAFIDACLRSSKRNAAWVKL